MAKREGEYPYGEKRGGAIVEDFVYKDEKGRVYSRVERTEDKQFPQSTKANGRWEPHAPALPILYMLEQLAKRRKDDVHIGEGEGKVNALFDLGFLATTNPGGAGKWNSRFNKWFKGRQRVFIHEDNDYAGKQHSLNIAYNLADIVPDVRIIHYYDMPPSGDVKDFINTLEGDAETKRNAIQKRCDEARRFAELPVIRLGTNASEISDEIDRTIAKYQSVKSKGRKQSVLVFGGDRLVEVVWRSNQLTARYHEGVAMTVDAVQFVEIERYKLEHILSKHICQFAKWEKSSKQWVPCKPGKDVLEGYLKRRPWDQPEVYGIITAPTMRPDGSILNEPGYDKKTKLYYKPPHDIEVTMPPVPDKPTKKQAQDALELLKDLFSETMFEDEDPNVPISRSVVLAALLTVVARGAFDQTPMFLFTAHQSGTGKSYLADIIAHIITAQWCPVINLGNNKEEREKRLGAILLEGMPLISFDNLNIDLYDETLCQMVEQPTVKVRVLRESKVPTCRWRGTILATGNNVQFTDDMVRRGLVCRLYSDLDRPETHEYKKDPLAMILNDRGKYIAAALTIVRAFYVSKEKISCSRLGDKFDNFTQFIRKPLIWLGEPDPIECQKKMNEEDKQRKIARGFLQLWKQLIGLNEAIRARDIIAQAYHTSRWGTPSAEQMKEKPKLAAQVELWDILMERCGKDRGDDIDAKRLGWWLLKLVGQNHGGLRVSIAKATDIGNKWRLMEVKTRGV